MIPSPKKSIFLYKKATIAPPPGPTIGSVDASGHIKPMHAYYTSTSLPGFSPTRPTERERERDPGKRWSHVSQNLGDYKQTIWGRGR